MVHTGHWAAMVSMNDTNLEGQPQLGASLVGAHSCIASYHSCSFTSQTHNLWTFLHPKITPQCECTLTYEKIPLWDIKSSFN
jgi:hypothetical protein